MIFVLLSSNYSLARPYITHISDTPLNYTMVISGGGFNPETVKVIVYYPHIVSGDESAISESIKKLSLSYSGKTESGPSVPPAGNNLTLTPINSTKNSVFVKFSPGKYRVHGGNTIAFIWLKDGEKLSNPYMLNKPYAWFLLKEESRPGELNRIYGLNLKADRYLDNHVFIKPEKGGEPVELSKVPIHFQDGWIEKFGIQFRIPGDIKPGSYLVFAHNNSGDQYGFTNTLPLEIVSGGDRTEKLYTATEYGVKGESISDNRAALQRVINKAGESGGGIVFLPTGSYRLDGTISLQKGVILRGAGRGVTTLFYGGDSTDGRVKPWLISAHNADNSGLEDLAVRVAGKVNEIIRYYGGDKENMIGNTHLARCRFEGGTVAVHNNTDIEISENVFDKAGLFVFNMKRGWIHGNEFTTGRFGKNPVVMWATEDSVIEHNNVYRSPRGFVWQIHGNFGHYHNIIDANTVEDIRFGGNAGETYLFEGSGFKWSGTPDSIQRDGVKVNEASWKPGSMKNAFAVVISGQGAGEYIRIRENTENAVKLTKPWEIEPSGNVRISVLQGVVENIFVNNLDRDGDNAMMFYGAGAINNRIYRNRSENSGGIGIYTRGDDKGIIPDYYNIFDGNVLEDRGNFKLGRLGSTDELKGIRNLDNIFRNNFISDVRDKRGNQYWNTWEKNEPGSSTADNAGISMGLGTNSKNVNFRPVWKDTLIERNYITRSRSGVNVQGTGEGTLIYRNHLSDVGEPFINNGINTKIINNTVERNDLLPRYYKNGNLVQ